MAADNKVKDKLMILIGKKANDGGSLFGGANKTPKKKSAKLEAIEELASDLISAVHAKDKETVSQVLASIIKSGCPDCLADEDDDE